MDNFRSPYPTKKATPLTEAAFIGLLAIKLPAQAIQQMKSLLKLPTTKKLN
jgi:hypothetical protein